MPIKVIQGFELIKVQQNDGALFVAFEGSTQIFDELAAVWQPCQNICVSNAVRLFLCCPQLRRVTTVKEESVNPEEENYSPKFPQVPLLLGAHEVRPQGLYEAKCCNERH